MAGCQVTIALSLMFVPYLTVGCAASAASPKEVQFALTNMILHQSYQRCGSVDFTAQRTVCEIWDGDDENTLASLGQCSGRPSRDDEDQSRCPDGSVRKVCAPRVTSYNDFVCVCEYLKRDPVSSAYKWDAEWRDFNDSRQGLYRKLCDQTTWSCVAAEYKFGLAHLVKNTQLPDGRITASSVYNNNFLPKRARIDNYFSLACGWLWSGNGDDPYRWVQFDLIRSFVGVGILMRARCDKDIQRTTKFKVGVSTDGSSWEFSEDVSADYGKTESSGFLSFTHWFQQPYSGQYWRIHPLAYVGHSVVKADIIGEV